ncbi:hypothetical protein [Bacillus sp. UNC322MFChir4.1]|uniref:hypothetical protein n=1 Tax=Bacillus sp. UNC322MFChir4.1 TaxID=1449045 RepID=UPI0005528A94|nr:hypothetical protein [Bacillus sp. UNC322MFChir4.1]
MGTLIGTIGAFEKFIDHLKSMMNQLSVPLLLIGLEAPKTFKIIERKENVRKFRKVVRLNEDDFHNDLFI